MSIQKSAYEDSDSDSDSDVSHALSEASSVSSYQLRKKDKGMKNVVERKDVFVTQQLEESRCPKTTRSMEHLTESKNSGKQLTIKHIISEVIMMKHLIQLSWSQEIQRNATEIQTNSRQKDV